MAAEQEPALEEPEPLSRPRHRRRRIASVIAGVLLATLIATWFGRERIADTLISGQLADMGLPATYSIESIGPGRQVLNHVVIGDPAHPDMTIERVEAVVEARLSGPVIGRVRLIKPRLYGTYRNGRLSFGKLDPVIFGKGDGEPFRLPDMTLAIEDGRGLIESDFGPVGLKVQGDGNLRGGFSGILAAIAPRVALGGCAIDRISLFGKVTIGAERPKLTGPLRVARLDCSDQGVRLTNAGVQIDVTADRSLDGVEGRVSLNTGMLGFARGQVAGVTGNGRLVFRNRALTLRYDVAANDVAAPQAAARFLGVEGQLRTDADFTRLEVEGNVVGKALRLGNALDETLAGVQRDVDGTLAEPLLAKLRAGLRREAVSSRLAASFLVRRDGRATNLVLPQAALHGGSGDTLISLSRVQLTYDGAGPPRIGGNFATGGVDMPQMSGRLERPAGGSLVMRMTMAPYVSGTARLAVPSLTLVQLPNGGLGFSGEARLSGALPGGATENLWLPVRGNWSSDSGLALWRECMILRFDSLTLANLTIERRALPLCPEHGGAIVRADAGGLRIAAGAASLNVAGRLGETPIRIRSGAVGFAVPGFLNARAIEVSLGPPATASNFRISRLDARVGTEVAGRFAGSEVRLGAVPLDLLDAAGDWRYADGRLTLSNGAFRLEDRQPAGRFRPLVARGATLSLADNVILADALLREPVSGREILRTAIRHDLAKGRGYADLAVDGIAFDDRLQPDMLTPLALGVVANARGLLRGGGRIDWTPAAVTSSGRFSTDSLDFAALFGPVKGASGTIVFTDLLGMVTAPDQQLRIASINPGVEVNDGVVTYRLRPNSVLAVEGAHWPFMDGTLVLRPVTMNLGIAEVRRYTLDIEGLNAARFVERLELANLAATGTFDGSLPLVFDENGGRIEGGMLRSRSPGGNVSYVGALTYKDLSTMANFAFDALKSLDYREMTIGMDGPLEGELVTRVRFFGVKQGTAAKRNFLTERVGKLPIQFNVNLRAPFLQLVSSFKSLYDPAYVRDPRGLGLIDAQGRPIRQPAPANPPIQP